MRLIFFFCWFFVVVVVEFICLIMMLGNDCPFITSLQEYKTASSQVTQASQASQISQISIVSDDEEDDQPGTYFCCWLDFVSQSSSSAPITNTTKHCSFLSQELH